MRKRERKTKKKHVPKRKEQDLFERKLRELANMQLNLETMKALRELSKKDENECNHVLASLVWKQAENLGLINSDGDEEGTEYESEEEEEESSALATQC